MEREHDKLKKVSEILRMSKPDPGNTGLLTGKVLDRIAGESLEPSFQERLFDLLFGWAYIGWIRSAMVTASFGLLIFFVYQQGVIMKRIDSLAPATLPGDVSYKPVKNARYTPRISTLSLMRKGLGVLPSDLKEKEIDAFINSVNDLREKYHELFEVIEKDPELKKYIEDRLQINSSEKQSNRKQ